MVKKIWIFLFLIFLNGIAVAEPKSGFDACSISLNEKLQQSWSSAVYVFEGEFSFNKDEMVKSNLTEDMVLLSGLTFRISKSLKGSLDSNLLKMKLAIKSDFVSYAKMESGKVKKIQNENFNLERKCEKKEINSVQLENKIKNALNALFDPKFIPVFSVYAGGLDYAYRKIDVPLFEDTKYYLFFFKELSKEDNYIFSSDVDIYSSEYQPSMKNKFSLN